MESNNYYLQEAQKLSKLQKNEQCTSISLKNPIVLYPISSFIVLFLSSILTVLKLKFYNMVLLPLKLLAGMIMICMFTILLILICNFFSSTTTWISAILFFLITSLGAPILIYFGGFVLIAVYVLGISGTTLASLLYYFKDNIDSYINGDNNNVSNSTGATVATNATNTSEQVPVTNDASTAMLQKEIDKAFPNVKTEAESSETSNLTAGTLNDSVHIEISQ